MPSAISLNIDVARQVSEVIGELRAYQQRLGLPPEDAADDDPREQLRLILGYIENNRDRMHYEHYRRAGLPTTSAWMESAVKEINYRVKGTEMFWNNPAGAEAILQIRAVALSDDGRLLRFLTLRPGFPSSAAPSPPSTKPLRRANLDMHPVNGYDISSVAAVGRFVAGRGINPNVAGAVNVAGSHDDDLAWTHTGQPLQLDHRRHLSGDVRQDSAYVLVWTGRTGSDSRASVRPFFSGATACRACRTLDGTSSFSTAHLKFRRMRLILIDERNGGRSAS